MPKISDIILKGRFLILILFIGIVTLMIQFAKDVKLSYEVAKILPSDDQTYIDYEDFKSEFGESMNTIVIAVQDVDFFDKDHLKAWNSFGEDIESIEGIDRVINITQLPILATDSIKQKFIYNSWYHSDMTESEVENAVELLKDQKIYKGKFYNKDANSGIMLVDINKKVLASPQRKNVIDRIIASGDIYSSKLNNIDVKYSGLPYIRTKESIKIKDEISLFIIYTLLITSFILLLFFRSFKATFISIVVVLVGVIFSFGTMGILNYDINLLSALVPPVIIVIGIPNCIFLINKYHIEFTKNKNKDQSLHVMISKIGNITLLTNLTTASGFAAFTLTKSETLQEFGLVAAISIIFIFIISLLLIPIWFSFFREPKLRHTRHLDKKWVLYVVEMFSNWIKNKRNVIYIFSGILTIIGLFGLSMVQTTGNVTDDLSRNGDVYNDFKFFEDNFGGVMPLEIIIDSKDTNGIYKASFMSNIQKIQDELSTYEEFSPSVSYIEFVKYANQAYKDDGEKYFTLPQKMLLPRLRSMLDKSEEINSLDIILTDEINSKARISLRMNDLATPQMDTILSKLRPKIESIFNQEEFDVVITGSSRVFLEGTKYLVGNLAYSLLLVIFLISIFMAWMFRSSRMVIVSLIPNLIPLLLTAAIMGYFSIPIKPSTILVFSIAFGISVDDTIHFLAKYRQELVASNWNIKKSVFNALKETGVSMIYTSVVLFFGFFVFVASDFGGTQALGVLVSITLFFAMLSNLLLLPALLLTLEQLITTKSFKEPLIDIFDEEEDIDLKQLKVKRK
ncbi:MAG: MMPL family transporter [Flavobacteriales bacterium]|mgnify:FL=1|jgi:predicted RND superfamily exporter protein|nr:MMPL family transporter [Flavobacteriales bacterium]